MVSIQILVDDDGNRQALAELVTERHSPIISTEFRPADLHIVDEPSLSRHRSDIEAYQRDQAPIFCPVILVRNSRTQSEVTLREPTFDQGPILVDQLIDAPVDTQILFRQIESLLVRRQQMIKLHEKERMELFARTLRHELRNPLQILNGWLDIAEKEGDEEAFENCRRAVERMTHLLDETLIILDKGDLAVDRESIDLASRARECWNMVPLSGGTIHIETDRVVEADSDRLDQLLTNIFRNAVEHGGDEVTVSDIEGGFAIEDDGPGIPEQDRKTVLNEGYSTLEANSGLGLAVVAAVASAHEWDFTVTESESGGARFIFTGV